METDEKEKDGECLHEDQVWDIEEISLSKCMFQPEAVLETEIRFGAAKVGQDLNGRKDVSTTPPMSCEMAIPNSNANLHRLHP